MKKKSAKTTSEKTGTRLKKAVKRVLSKAVPARKKKSPVTSASSAKKSSSAKKNGLGPITVKLVKKAPLPAANPVFEIKDLPFSYNKTTLVLLVRDPEWGYAYWDFSESTWNWIQNFLSKDSAAKIKIRIHDLTRGGYYDVDVNLDAKNWYIRLAHDNHEFEAELGLLDSSGKFHTIAKSNRVRTPRSKPSDKVDPRWDPKNFEELYRLSGGGQFGGGSELLSNFTKKNY
jgi:uncharacterized protein